MEIKTTKEIMLTYNDNKTLEYKWVRVEEIKRKLKNNLQTDIIECLCGSIRPEYYKIIIKRIYGNFDRFIEDELSKSRDDKILVSDQKPIKNASENRLSLKQSISSQDTQRKSKDFLVHKNGDILCEPSEDKVDTLKDRTPKSSQGFKP
jgi:predicted house-cleaning noncanonical NTP pyrophosphatase (MazG superfamily)